MKILIFGATGLTGKILTQKSLEKGYEVTVYVRNPQKIDFSHPNLQIITG